MPSLSQGPWDMVHTDVSGPFPTDELVLVATDTYSRFPEVEIIHSTSAKATALKLDRIFVTHGRPRTIKTDNSPHLNSAELAEFMKQSGIKYERITQ